MPPNEPTSFTDEDRARLHRIVDAHTRYGDGYTDDLGTAGWAALTRALAYIDHLEGALGAADELVDLLGSEEIMMGGIASIDLPPVIAAYRSARAALPTSKEGD